MSSKTCSWNMTFIEDCLNDNLKWFYYVAITSFVIITLLTTIILIYKCCDNSPLWDDYMFEPSFGFLFWLALQALSRTLLLIIIFLNIFPGCYILRTIINGSSWIFGTCVSATYLVGIFRAIPRLTFHQSTTNREDNQSKPTTSFIPNQRSLATIYWTFIITFSIIIFTLTSIRGYAVSTHKDNMNNTVSLIILFVIGISNISIVLCFLKYGGLLFTLINECALITGGKDFRVRVQSELHKSYVNKLRILSSSITILVLWSSMSCFVFSILGTMAKGSTVMLYILIIVNKLLTVLGILVTFSGVFYYQLSAAKTNSIVDVDDTDTFDVA
ncbi:hypothetical protein Glove_74g278 [Diversispora epigaea]|uniref:Uncharacterized protein n=1 Tax=Diversispora epigaea TaxID=1348612 RepID=A0A397J915_9GLOM|nr:hypothetical protein Glove_74g278 [Diversispora epigaea]